MQYTNRPIGNPAQEYLPFTDMRQANSGMLKSQLKEEPTIVRRWKILLVDDDALVRHAVQAILLSFDQDVDMASSVSEALYYLQNGKYDLMITDYNMPGGNGSELIKLVRYGETATRTVMTTGQDVTSLLSELSFEERPEILLPKPFKFNDIRQLLLMMQTDPD